MASIRLQGLYKKYDNDHVALRDANLEVSDGEFLVLVGPSGCGKSTLLRMIAGLEEITGGEIFIGDRCVNELSPGNRDIAMVFQNYALYPHMTVRENLGFGLKMKRAAKTEIRQRVDEAAAILSIESLLDRRPKELSGGQRQRVAVGRAIVRKPAAFLFDEPLSNLDARLRVQMRKELADLHRRLQTTMVYVTHDQVEAMTLGQRIVVMNEGEIQQIATPMDLYRQPANKFVAGFIGSPAMNLVDGRIVRRDDDIAEFRSGEAHFTIRISRGVELPENCTLGFRPEHLSLGPGSSGSPTGEEPPNARKLADAVVDVVERLGDETFAYFQLGNTPCIARLPGDHLIERGDRLALHLPPEQWHLFAVDRPFPRIASGSAKIASDSGII